MMKNVREAIRQLTKLQDDPDKWILLDDTHVNRQNVTKPHRILLFGPHKSPYEGGVFELKLHIPSEFPLKPPTLSMVTPMWHVHVNKAGVVCSPIKDIWSDAMKAQKVNKGKKIITNTNNSPSLKSTPNAENATNNNNTNNTNNVNNNNDNNNKWPKVDYNNHFEISIRGFLLSFYENLQSETPDLVEALNEEALHQLQESPKEYLKQAREWTEKFALKQNDMSMRFDIVWEKGVTMTLYHGSNNANHNNYTPDSDNNNNNNNNNIVCKTFLAFDEKLIGKLKRCDYLGFVHFFELTDQFIKKSICDIDTIDICNDPKYIEKVGKSKHQASQQNKDELSYLYGFEKVDINALVTKLAGGPGCIAGGGTSNVNSGGRGKYSRYSKGGAGGGRRPSGNGRGNNRGGGYGGGYGGGGNGGDDGDNNKKPNNHNNNNNSNNNNNNKKKSKKSKKNNNNNNTNNEVDDSESNSDSDSDNDDRGKNNGIRLNEARNRLNDLRDAAGVLAPINTQVQQLQGKKGQLSKSKPLYQQPHSQTQTQTQSQAPMSSVNNNNNNNYNNNNDDLGSGLAVGTTSTDSPSMSSLRNLPSLPDVSMAAGASTPSSVPPEPAVRSPLYDTGKPLRDIMICRGIYNCSGHCGNKLMNAAMKFYNGLITQELNNDLFNCKTHTTVEQHQIEMWKELLKVFDNNKNEELLCDMFCLIELMGGTFDGSDGKNFEITVFNDETFDLDTEFETPTTTTTAATNDNDNNNRDNNNNNNSNDDDDDDEEEEEDEDVNKNCGAIDGDDESHYGDNDNDNDNIKEYLMFTKVKELFDKRKDEERRKRIKDWACVMFSEFDKFFDKRHKPQIQRQGRQQQQQQHQPQNNNNNNDGSVRVNIDTEVYIMHEDEKYDYEVDNERYDKWDNDRSKFILNYLLRCICVHSYGMVDNYNKYFGMNDLSFEVNTTINFGGLTQMNHTINVNILEKTIEKVQEKFTYQMMQEMVYDSGAADFDILRLLTITSKFLVECETTFDLNVKCINSKTTNLTCNSIIDDPTYKGYATIQSMRRRVDEIYHHKRNIMVTLDNGKREPMLSRDMIAAIRLYTIEAVCTSLKESHRRGETCKYRNICALILQGLKRMKKYDTGYDILKGKDLYCGLANVTFKDNRQGSLDGLLSRIGKASDMHKDFVAKNALQYCLPWHSLTSTTTDLRVALGFSQPPPDASSSSLSSSYASNTAAISGNVSSASTSGSVSAASATTTATTATTATSATSASGKSNSNSSWSKPKSSIPTMVSKSSIIFKILKNTLASDISITYGDISWISVLQHEKEVLIGPCLLQPFKPKAKTQKTQGGFHKTTEIKVRPKPIQHIRVLFHLNNQSKYPFNNNKKDQSASVIGGNGYGNNQGGSGGGGGFSSNQDVSSHSFAVGNMTGGSTINTGIRHGSVGIGTGSSDHGDNNINININDNGNENDNVDDDDGKEINASVTNESSNNTLAGINQTDADNQETELKQWINRLFGNKSEDEKEAIFEAFVDSDFPTLADIYSDLSLNQLNKQFKETFPRARDRDVIVDDIYKQFTNLNGFQQSIHNILENAFATDKQKDKKVRRHFVTFMNEYKKCDETNMKELTTEQLDKEVGIAKAGVRSEIHREIQKLN